jgi:hypothetical protein
VNQLASVLCTKPCHYLYTFTLNEKECVALAPIEAWINSEETMLTICARELMSDKDEKKYKQALRDSAASVKLRSWIEFSHTCFFDIFNSVPNHLWDVWIICSQGWSFRMMF